MRAELARRLETLIVFMDLNEDPVFSAFVELLKADEADSYAKAARFTGLLYKAGSVSWTDYLFEKIDNMPTCLSDAYIAFGSIPERMVNVAMDELSAISQACSITPADLGLVRDLWSAEPIDFQAGYLNRLLLIDQTGIGMFGLHHMFRLKRSNDLELVPVTNPDPVTFAELYGYDSQHQTMIENTEGLLAGKPAGNLLLYGDAGTGKSASIKALANRFNKQGLRLIEVGKDRIEILPELLDLIAKQPLKFIIYIDDLSFSEDDDSFAQLKAVLEGSVSARSANTVIYATSNRRHLVTESFSARTGDDMHVRDTLQETLSLSQRFGQCIFFERPNAEEYLKLIHLIAKEYGLQEDETIEKRASAYALAQGGRSPRIARQFIENEMVKAQEGE